MLLYCLRRALQPSATGTGSFRSDASTSGSAVSPAACMILCVRFACLVRKKTIPYSYSVTDATLDTGGWLTLTRQGLSPCKMHQASLGARTVKLRCWRDSSPAVGYTKSYHVTSTMKHSAVYIYENYSPASCANRTEQMPRDPESKLLHPRPKGPMKFLLVYLRST